MTVEQALQIIWSLIDGVQCDGPNRRKIEQAYAVLKAIASKGPPEPVTKYIQGSDPNSPPSDEPVNQAEPE